MKKFVLIVLAVLLAGLLVFSFSGLHSNRNNNNRFPKGFLTQKDSVTYQDEVGLIWEIQPHGANTFHQPDALPVVTHNQKYKVLENSPRIDPEHPNVKLLCLLPSGTSYEAILQPNGTYLNTSSKTSTYNYSSPKGFWASVKHGIFDVLPHLINSNYSPTKTNEKIKS